MTGEISEWAEASRARQGLPSGITDPPALHAIARIIAARPRGTTPRAASSVPTASQQDRQHATG